MDEPVTIELNRFEMLALMEALKYVAEEGVIRSDLTAGDKSNLLPYMAKRIYDDLCDEEYESLLEGYILEYYSQKAHDIGG